MPFWRGPVAFVRLRAAAAVALSAAVLTPEALGSAGGIDAAPQSDCPSTPGLPTKYSVDRGVWWSFLDGFSVSAGGRDFGFAMRSVCSLSKEMRLLAPDGSFLGSARNGLMNSAVIFFDCRGRPFARLMCSGWGWLQTPNICEVHSAAGRLVGLLRRVDLSVARTDAVVFQDLSGRIAARVVQSSIGPAVWTDVRAELPGGDGNNADAGAPIDKDAALLVDPRMLVLFSSMRLGAGLLLIAGPLPVAFAALLVCAVCLGAVGLALLSFQRHQDGTYARLRQRDHVPLLPLPGSSVRGCHRVILDTEHDPSLPGTPRAPASPLSLASLRSGSLCTLLPLFHAVDEPPCSELGAQASRRESSLSNASSGQRLLPNREIADNFPEPQRGWISSILNCGCVDGGTKWQQGMQVEAIPHVMGAYAPAPMPPPPQSSFSPSGRGPFQSLWPSRSLTAQTDQRDEILYRL